MPPQPEIDNLPPVSPRDLGTYTRRRQVCELVQAGCASGLPTAANDLLARMIAADPKDTLLPSKTDKVFSTHLSQWSL